MGAKSPVSLVTGGAGFLGSHLCDRLLAEGHRVICMDNLVTGDTANIAHLIGHERFRFIHHDVTEYIFIDGPIDHILHFASPASPIDYLKLPIQTLKVGSLGTHKALGLAKAKGADVSELVVCVLDRPRHADLIAKVREAGARIMLIMDGDVSGVIATAQPESGVDLYLGTGGAPEGVLAAAALRAIGGQIQGRLLFRNDDERARAKKWGITDLNRKYSMLEMAKGDVMFAATGVTSGSAPTSSISPTPSRSASRQASRSSSSLARFTISSGCRSRANPPPSCRSSRPCGPRGTPSARPRL